MRKPSPLVLAACALALALGAVGCAGEDAPAVTGDPDQGDVVAAPPPAEPALNRRDAPPKGVLRQVQYYGIGDQLCRPTGVPTASHDTTPFYSTQRKPTYEPEIGEELHLCATDFLLDLPVEMTLLRPDGRTLRRVDPAGAQSRSRQWTVFLDERWPVGRYVLTARQGSVVRRDAFRVLLPRLRGVRNAGDAVHPGEPLHLVVVGQRPRTTVPIDVYRSGGAGTSRYATTFTIRTDERGIGARTLVPSARDLGQYLLRPRTAIHADGQDAMTGVSIMPPPPPIPSASPSNGEEAPTIFQADEAPPEGTPASLALWVHEEPPDCYSAEEGPHIAWDLEPPRASIVDTTEREPEIGDSLTFCAEGISLASRPQLTLVGPDGNRRSAVMARRSRAEATRTHTHVFTPDDPLGEYEAIVVGAGERARIRFELRAAHAPGYRLLERDGQLSLLAVGLPPRQAVSLRAYRGPRLPVGEASDADAAYAGAISADADEDGVVQIPLALDPARDPAGCYVFRLAYGERVIPPGVPELTTVCLPLDER